MQAGPDSSHSVAVHEMVARIKQEAAKAREPWQVLGRERVYHYTTCEAACNILKQQALWAFDVLSMSKDREFRDVAKFVDKELAKFRRMLPDRVATYFNDEKLVSLGNRWHMFAASFCTEPDLPSEKKNGFSGQGVAIGFHTKQLDNFGGKLKEFGIIPIHYDYGMLREEIGRSCKLTDQLARSTQLPQGEVGLVWNEMVLQLLHSTLSFKHPRHSHEKEYRALTMLTADDSSRISINCGPGERRRHYVEDHFESGMVFEILVDSDSDDKVESELQKVLGEKASYNAAIRRSNRVGA